MKTKRFTSFRSVLVPVVYGCKGQSALDAARALGAQVTLVGVVPVPPEVSLSKGAVMARQVRQQMRTLLETGSLGQAVSSRVRVIVSHTPWKELLKFISSEEPDLLILEWDEHFAALGVSAADALMRPPCNVALARG